MPILQYASKVLRSPKNRAELDSVDPGEVLGGMWVGRCVAWEEDGIRYTRTEDRTVLASATLRAS